MRAFYEYDVKISVSSSFHYSGFVKLLLNIFLRDCVAGTNSTINLSVRKNEVR
jgi:hypothetical protein